MPGIVADMASITSQDIRQSRLHELGQEWGLDSSVLPEALTRPDTAPSYRTDDDEHAAEELLRRQRILETQHAQSKHNLSRAFTTKKKSWEYKEIYNALVSHVTNHGSPGVAEALITKLNVVGGNVNLSQKSRTSLLTRRKSLDLSERSQVLQRAVENRHKEMVEVLLPFADALSLDTALPVAMRNQDLSIVELLVRYGAGVAQTAEGLEAFRHACALGGSADLIALVLSSDGHPSVDWVSQSMVEAARVGCLNTVVVLSQSIADGNHDNAAALKAAVGLGRRDVALAVILGNHPPGQVGLNETFDQLMSSENINPNDKIAMAEVLLCAGAQGDATAKALVQACTTDYIDMIHLLVQYGTSIEFQDAAAVKKIVSKARMDQAEIVLNGSARLTEAQASECVALLPKKMRFEDRYALLTHLLRQGAHGPPLDEALIDVADAGDMEAAKLLVTPQFPGKMVGNKSVKSGPRSMVFEKHAVASTNHKGALALQLAVRHRNVPISKLILVNQPPGKDALAQVFPSVRNLPKLERYQLTEAFVTAGVAGPSVHSALQNVIDELPPHRDDRLVSILLRANADVNFNEGAVITAVISQKDVSLLARLLKSHPKPEIAAKALPKAMALDNPDKRSQMVSLLLGAGAAHSSSEVSAALSKLIQAKPIDKALLRVLLQQGNADVNANEGLALVSAIHDPDPEVLGSVLELGRPSTETLEKGLETVGQLPSSLVKSEKLDAILRRIESPEMVDNLLIQEVLSVLSTAPEKRTLAVMKTLLTHGADVNANNGEALCRAVAAANEAMLDLLFAANPNPHSLSFAMPHALRIQDLMDRLTFAQRILESGIPPNEVNRALVFAVSTYPDDIPLINALLSYADTKDGMALLEAIKKENQDVVELMLVKKKFSSDVLNHGFTQATRGKNRRTRSISCRSLLTAGASGDVVSDALLAAATDGDLELGAILVQNGGDIDHKGGQAVVEACKAGATEVLGMLLCENSKVTQPTLQRGFQAATELSDLQKRAEVFRLLLQQGVSGEVVDAELVSAGRYGARGTELVRLLLAHGASPDYNHGEVVEKATESAFLDNLAMLLGITEVGGKQKRPSSATLVRAMNASWSLSRDTRFTVMEWIFKAGKPVPNTVHDALTRAVNEEDPEDRLIQLLVTHRASPTANGCQTLIDAARRLPVSTFAHLAESKVTPEEASLVFAQAFAPDHCNEWLSERGLEVARYLLKKGACGEGVGSAFAAVLGRYAANPGDLHQSFMELLLKYDAEINHNHGEALQVAASQGNPDLVRRLLQEKPNAEALTLAFPRVFSEGVSEDAAQELITVFTEHGEGEDRLDVMFSYPNAEPILVRALSQFPRSTKILQALLDAGYYHEQMATCRVTTEVEEDEQVTLLMWALVQPQKKISSGVVNLLIERGAKVNFETRVTRVTPLMLAIESRRQDVVKSLLLAGAEVDVTDALGRSPLSMASGVGGELAITMMSNLLAAGASRNDGSLHNAARELNLQAMQILVEYRHEPDFPSPQHGGRSALGELCLHAADTGEITALREKTMEKCITFLLQDSDIALQSDGKSVLLLALESADPVATTKVLLRADMWKHINKPFNQYTDGKFTYSPTQYVSRVLAQTDASAQLLTLLKANRGTDVYYANAGPQPDDAVGMPSALQAEEQERKARLERIARENEDHAIMVARQKELAAVQSRIWAEQAEIEDARKKRAQTSDMTAMQERARVEEELFNKSLQQQRAKQQLEVMHQQKLTEATIQRARQVGDAELAMETQRQSRMLGWERDLGNERVGNATQMSNIKLREREELDRIDAEADGRFQAKLREQKKLVESQNHLATNLGNQGPAGRRQIGYVTGELD